MRVDAVDGDDHFHSRRLCPATPALPFFLICQALPDYAADGGYSAMGPEQAVPAIPRLAE